MTADLYTEKIPECAGLQYTPNSIMRRFMIVKMRFT